jgi:hypothetical protein
LTLEEHDRIVAAARKHAQESTAAQGLPHKITDPDAYRKLATLILASRKRPAA